MAAFGSLVERVIVRPILGYPQFSIVMVTIGLGFALRAVVGMIWGTDDLRIDTPFSSGVMHVGKLVIAHDKLSVIVATVLLCGALWLFFNKTRMGVAMQATFAEHARRPTTWASRSSAWCRSIWAISAAVAACAGVLLAPITFIHSNVGLVLGLKAFPAAVLGGFGSHPRRGGRRRLIGVDREHRRASTLPEGFEGRRRLHSFSSWC